MRRHLLAALCLAATTLSLASCGLGFITIVGPGATVTTYSFDVEIFLTGSFVPNTFSATLNGTDITGSFSGGPEVYTATINPGSPLRDTNVLRAHAQKTNGGGTLTDWAFVYDPPGKARISQITLDSERITGPLGHSRIGDYVL
jgi:hypothetical protein